MNPEKSMWEQDPGMIIYIALKDSAGVEQLVDRWIGMSAEEKKPYVETGGAVQKTTKILSQCSSSPTLNPNRAASPPGAAQLYEADHDHRPPPCPDSGQPQTPRKETTPCAFIVTSTVIRCPWPTSGRLSEAWGSSPASCWPS